MCFRGSRKQERTGGERGRKEEREWDWPRDDSKRTGWGQVSPDLACVETPNLVTLLGGDVLLGTEMDLGVTTDTVY